MSTRKERLTVTVNPDYIEAGNRAVAEGRAESMSAWVNAALSEKVMKEQRLSALAAAIAAYEKKHGVISAQELAEQARTDRESAIVVRGVARVPRPKSKRRKTG
jgi:hypothetical protein